MSNTALTAQEEEAGHQEAAPMSIAPAATVSPLVPSVIVVLAPEGRADHDLGCLTG